MIHSLIAFFWKDEPEPLMDPVAQLMLAAALPDALPEDDAEPPSDPHAASAAAPAIPTAKKRALRETRTLILHRVVAMTDVNVGERDDATVCPE